MLNLSENNIRHLVDPGQLSAYQHTTMARIHFSFTRLLLVFILVLIGFMFLPWTQNIQGAGKVTTLRPEQRPQTIHATISGRIEQWHVSEGQAIHKGDTIAHLSEVKSEYFDPELIERTGDALAAKTQAVGAYGNKVGALETQIEAMRAELRSKTASIRNKVKQAELKVDNDRNDVERTKVDLQIAGRQLAGSKNMYDKGLESLTKLEEKRSKMQEYTTKIAIAENKLQISQNELENLRVELQLIENETANKIAKTQSEKFSTLSEQYDATATVSKLKIDRENYARRASFYYITAPQDGYIVQAVQPGIGEIIKEGAPIVSILPADYQLAVEMYVSPMDMPLIHTGNTVRFMFDGWPAFFFSGWPGQSFGTYAGKVAAIDRTISANGKFRILVAPDPNETAWPEALRVGGGAKGIALLTNVPIWYELWRTLNGFPANFYQPANPSKTEKTGADSKK